jgi:1-acyl-sn-glycerol-3-phosphate acyltransferase
MLYHILHWIGGIAIHWFYKDIIVVHRDRIPKQGPLFVAVNHPNAMVDALLAGWVVPRRLTITAKATLFDNPLGAALFKAVGMIPLRRMSDERARLAAAAAGSTGADRNRDAFQRIVDELNGEGAVLIFPEGKSHHDLDVAPLKTGLARSALRARDEGVRGINIIPIGLTFENKAEPGTNVVIQVAEPVSLDQYAGKDADALTDVIAERLREVSHTGDVGTPIAPPRHSRFVRLAALWGRVIHRVPIELARKMAVARSKNPDEPAMYTMTYGLGLTLAWYAIQLPVVWWLAGGWAALAYFALLCGGAYATAYVD